MLLAATRTADLTPPVRTMPARLLNWRGRSGACYRLEPESLDRFALADGALHVLALGNRVLWVGSSADLVADAATRARFRLALDCADRVFRVTGTPSEAERMTAIWDIESAEPVTELFAA